jgi:hypothetical protein
MGELEMDWVKSVGLRVTQIQEKIYYKIFIKKNKWPKK